MERTNVNGRRQPWQYKKDALQYHRSIGYPAYTMVFNAALEAEMKDARMPKESRVLAAIKRFSWGRYCDYAVDALPPKELGDPKPRPLTQETIGEIIGLSTSTISEACIFLKQAGYLRKSHAFLFPEKLLNPLESSEDFGGDPDSTDSHSPYLRFKSSYLSENKQLNTIIAKLSEERNKLKTAAREISAELRRHDNDIRDAFRDWQRQQSEQEPQQNQQGASEEQNNGNLQRYCAPAHNESINIGEQKEYIDSVSTLSYILPQEMPPSAPPAFAAEIPGFASSKKPNKNGIHLESSLKPSKSLMPCSQSVSQSVPEVDRPTDRQREIKESIPAELLEALQDQPTIQLLDRIDQRIGPAPLSAFTQRIKERWLTITALGILPSLAADALRIWNKHQRDAQEPIPVRSARSAMDEAMELMEAEYGS